MWLTCYHVRCFVVCGGFDYSVDVLQRKLKGVRVGFFTPAAEKPTASALPVSWMARPWPSGGVGLRWLLSVLGKHVGAAGAQSRTAPQPWGPGGLPGACGVGPGRPSANRAISALCTAGQLFFFVTVYNKHLSFL